MNVFPPQHSFALCCATSLCNPHLLVSHTSQRTSCGFVLERFTRWYVLDAPALCLLRCLSPTSLAPFPSLLMNWHKVDTGLPSGWEVRHSNSKNLPYYFNEAQKQSRWEPPSGTDTDKLKVYMAEHHSQLELAPEATGLNGNATSGKIRASHLLIKHRDSRRPSSWRQVGCTYWCSCDLLIPA